MDAIRIRKKLESTTLEIPELQSMVGKHVEIVIMEQSTGEPLETMETFLGGRPEDPPTTPEEMAEMREAAKTDPALAAALELYESKALDVEAIVAMRAAG